MPRKMTLSFSQRYLSYIYHGSPIKIPAVHIKLIDHSGNSLKTFALGDSGATSSFMPREIAEIFEDIKTIEHSEATGAGGSFQTEIGVFAVQVIKGKKTYWSHDVMFHIPLEEGRIPYVILGRDSIFQAYNITFREKDQKTIFRRIKNRK